MAGISGFIIAAVMTGYAAVRQCRVGKPVRACVFGAGFFTAAVYLNQLCLLIMEGFRESVGESQMLDWLAVLVAQSIMLCVLFLQYSIDNGRDGRMEGSKEGSKEGSIEDSKEDSKEGSIEDSIKNSIKSGINTRETGERFDYADGISVGVSAFFLLLAAEDFWVYKTIYHFAAPAYRFAMLAFRFAALLIFYVSLLIYKKRKREKKTQEEVQTRKREADAYLKNVEDNYQRIRELWHDLKNHINLLKLLLSEGKYGQMADYLRVFSEDVDSLTLPVKSGNVIVDALLADKAARAKKEGAEVTLSLCNLTGLRMEPDDICGLLGNLLDNAIEANRQVEERRFIHVDCREQETCYYIQIKNAAAGRAVERDGYLLTSKTDRVNRVGHGLGLRSVERIVHGLGGELAVESGETEFTVVVRIPK